MKKILLNIACFGLLSSSAFGVVTITSATVQGFQDSSGVSLGGGVLGLLVVDGAGDGFNGVTETSSFAINDFLADGNDVIVNFVESTDPLPPFFPVASISGVGAGTTQVAFDSNVNAGDEFAVYWFPGLSASDDVNGFTAGDSFGIATFAGNSAILPSSGGSVQATANTSAGPALFNVQAIPEPTSTALLGLGGLALLARRRRA